MTLLFAPGDASSWLPQNPVCRFREIFRDKIGRHRPFCRMPFQFAFAVAATYEYAPGAHVLSKIDIHVSVADNKRAPQIEGVFTSGVVQHARFWLATAARVGGSVRAIVNCVNMRTRCGEMLIHELMHDVHERFRVVATTDARLVGDNHNRNTGFVEKTDRSRSKWKHTKSADMIQVADFLRDRAVAIEEDSGTQRVLITHAVPRWKRAKVLPQLPPSRE